MWHHFEVDVSLEGKQTFRSLGVERGEGANVICIFGAGEATQLVSFIGFRLARKIVMKRIC